MSTKVIVRGGNVRSVIPRRSPQWYRPLVAGLFGFLGGIYFVYTGDTLSWRVEALGGDPLLPVRALFDLHPLLGLTLFTATAFGVVWFEQYLERKYD